MKLRNKKTGEIVQLSVKCENGGELRTFDLETNTDKPITLAELNEDWEDYEEQKDIWWIDNEGDVYHCGGEVDGNFEKNREIGNYFETKEEAEKAVEKLKAWKRLKDKEFRFDDWKWIQQCINFKLDYTDFTGEQIDETVLDLELLFGGEE